MKYSSSQRRLLLEIQRKTQQLWVLSEAGMSRRDFLKFLGKGAAAGMGAPIEKTAGLIDKLGKLSSPSTFALTFHPSQGDPGPI